MVSTRNHKTAYPEPQLSSPSSRSDSPTSPSTALSTRRATSSSATTSGAWAHTPSNITLLWLAVSLPLVIWDTGYVLLRPHTMPGGWLHKPIWTPYALYGTVDYVYGKYAWDRNDGFTGAQGALNAVETLGYFVYLYLVFAHGTEVAGSKGRGAPKAAARSDSSLLRRLARARSVGGYEAGSAVLLLFAVSVMTLSKTVLYCKSAAPFRETRPD